MRTCRWQVRAGFNGVYGLDHGAVMAVAQGLGLGQLTQGPGFLAEVLPFAEALLVNSLTKEGD